MGFIIFVALYEVIGFGMFIRSLVAYHRCGYKIKDVAKDVAINNFILWPVVVYKIYKYMKGEDECD